MKDPAAISQKLQDLAKQIQKMETVEWQPGHLLLVRMGLPDPHEGLKVKPPMYFRGAKDQPSKGVEFEKKEVV